MGLTSKTGPDSDVDQLADDDGVEHPPKRQKTHSGTISKQQRKETNGSTLNFDSRSTSGSFAQLVQPGSNDGTIQLQNALNASFSNSIVSHKTVYGSTSSSQAVFNTRKRKAAVQPSAAPDPSVHDSDMRRPLDSKSRNSSGSMHPLVKSVSILRGTSKLSRSSISHPFLASEYVPSSNSSSSTLPGTTSSSRDTHRQLHRQAKATSAALGKPSTGYRANQDEINEWAEATVASIVFRKPTYSKKIEADARRMNGMKLMKTMGDLAMEVPTGNGSAMSAPNSDSFIKPVAVPRLSRSSRCEAIIKSLFGDETSTRKPLTTKPVR